MAVNPSVLIAPWEHIRTRLHKRAAKIVLPVKLLVPLVLNLLTTALTAGQVNTLPRKELFAKIVPRENSQILLGFHNVQNV